MTEPQTEAGKQLITALRDHAPWFLGGSGPAEARYVLAIEAQSRNATLDEVVRVVEGRMATVQRYSLTVEPDDSAYMELDPEGRYVIDYEAESAVLHAIEKLRG